MLRRIALISEHASPLAALGGADAGGQNVYVAQVAKHLAAQGHDVDVFTRREDPDIPARVRIAEGAYVVHVPAGPAAHVPKERILPYMGDFADHVLAAACRGRGYDIIHANFFMSALVACEVNRALDVPFVVTFHALGRVRKLHQGSADTFPDERLAIEDRAVREAGAVIAECPQDAEDLEDYYGADPGRLRLIPCGFDPCEFWPTDRRAARRVLGLDPDEPIVLQLGRMVPRKGVETAVRGVARLRRGYGVLARLLVVGGESREPDPAVTPEIGRLQSIARDEGIADGVTFVGSRGRDELRLYYAAADVFVTTPWYEPFGITPLEAMACGRPVVGSAVGGIKYTVKDGRTGFLVPPKDPDALAERLARLFREPGLLGEFGRRAVRRVRQLFTWERVAARVERLYEDVLTGAPIRRGGRAPRILALYPAQPPATVPPVELV